MGILTGRDEGIKMLAISDLAFIGTLTDYAKGLCLSLTNQQTKRKVICMVVSDSI